MNDLFMYLGLSVIGYMFYCIMKDKPILPFLANRKKKTISRQNASKSSTTEIKGDFKHLVGISEIHGNVVELVPRSGVRTFTGAVQCYPINYQLRSALEQQATDESYESLLASLNLGPGREVKTCDHIQSRPIDLVDQLRPYHENFPNISPIAQRYAQNLFFPFLKKWQSTVNDFDYNRYKFVILEYSPKMLEDLDESMIITKAQNDFVRLSQNIVSNYGRMGGVSEVCTIEELLEAMYFATHKRTASIEEFRKILNTEGRLSTVITSDYSRPAFRYEEKEEIDKDVEEAV